MNEYVRSSTDKNVKNQTELEEYNSQKKKKNH